MSIAATLMNTGLTPATSVAVAHFTSNLTAISNLSQNSTNGASQLGTLQAPNLETSWLPHSGSGAPWGSRTAFNANPYTQSPPSIGTYEFLVPSTSSTSSDFRQLLQLNSEASLLATYQFTIIPLPTAIRSVADITGNMSFSATVSHSHLFPQNNSMSTWSFLMFRFLA